MSIKAGVDVTEKMGVGVTKSGGRCYKSGGMLRFPDKHIEIIDHFPEPYIPYKGFKKA